MHAEGPHRPPLTTDLLQAPWVCSQLEYVEGTANGWPPAEARHAHRLTQTCKGNYLQQTGRMMTGRQFHFQKKHQGEGRAPSLTTPSSRAALYQARGRTAAPGFKGQPLQVK